MLRLSMILSVVAVVLLFVGFAVYDSTAEVRLHEATGLVVSLESFPVYLETHPIFKDLPSNANVKIIIGDSDYSVSGKGVAQEDNAEPDLTVTLPESYASRFGEIGLCGALKEAIAGNELQVSYGLSRLELIMKYRKLLKYRECLS